uniref:G-protein coupled receptors family 1 profile domain-containing protein n=1 Tax=Takifugu rubripes TaxID=31033 RepID=A0A674NPA9_TAKRU
MPGSAALLAAFAVFTAASRSSWVGAEMRSSTLPPPGETSGDRGGCPGRCRCEAVGLLHRVDCSDLGLREVPANLSVFTSYLTTEPANNVCVCVLPDDDIYSFISRMLQNNNLTSVPAEAFNDLQNLQSLRLDANHISDVPAGSFSGLRSLRHLWLDDNALEEVPVEALSHLPVLQAMTLALNHISHIPDHAFSKLGRLVVLHLNNNRIVSMGTNCFQGLHSLETLDLNSNRLVQFPAPVRSLPNLRELGFHSNNIRSIPERAFIGNPSLVTVYFHDNPIRTVGQSAFQNLPELQTLSLNGAAELREFPDLTGTTNLEISVLLSLCPPESLSSCISVLLSLCPPEPLSSCISVLLHLCPPESLSSCVHRDLSSNQLSSLPLMGLHSLTHLRLAGNTELMEPMAREDLPRVRVVELPYTFQCCAFISCESSSAGGGRGASWEREAAPDSAGTDPAVESGPADEDWEDLLMDFEDEAKVLAPVQCSPAPGPLHPCHHLLGSWVIRGGVWLIAVVALGSNSLVVLSVFCPRGTPTPARLLVGLLAAVNGLMGVWSGLLAAVDAWTYGSFWRYGTRWESGFLCRFSSFLCVFAAQAGLFLLTGAAVERYLSVAAQQRRGALPLSVRLAVALSFLLALALALPPLLAGGSSTSLCLPLPSSSSLVFTVSLVLLDSLCFFIMTLAYTRLYCRANKAPPPCEEEVVLTRHVAWLLFSDCLLYLPVAFLSFSSLLRLSAAGPEMAKGVLLLVTPLPACVNPLLYILFNPPARQELAALARRTYRLVSGGRAGAGSKVVDSTCDENAEKQSCDSTQALVAEGQTREDEEERGGRSQTCTVSVVVPQETGSLKTSRLLRSA